jgi:hypothetical protein
VRRRFHCLARPLAIALVVLGSTFSAPAGACLCSCSIFSSQSRDATATEVPAEYRQIFSGLVISTERINEPVAATTVSSGEFVVDPGYWIKSKILVLRIWRGTPSTLAEVWTPVQGNCDSPPITDFHFVALVRTEKGRSVAGNSPCDCDLKAAATEGRGAFTIAGFTVTAAAAGAAVLALLWLMKVIRRRRAPAG